MLHFALGSFFPGMACLLSLHKLRPYKETNSIAVEILKAGWNLQIKSMHSHLCPLLILLMWNWGDRVECCTVPKGNSVEAVLMWFFLQMVDLLGIVTEKILHIRKSHAFLYISFTWVKTNGWLGYSHSFGFSCYLFAGRLWNYREQPGHFHGVSPRQPYPEDRDSGMHLSSHRGDSPLDCYPCHFFLLQWYNFQPLPYFSSLLMVLLFPLSLYLKLLFLLCSRQRLRIPTQGISFHSTPLENFRFEATVSC